MDLFVFLFFLFGMALAVYAVGLLYKEIETLKLVTVAVSGWFTVFVLISGIFFWMDRFALLPVLITETLLMAAAAVGLLVWGRAWFFTACYKERGPLVFAIIFVGFLISFVKFDFFGMGQDQGVYQTKAIALAYGTTERQYCFPGIENMPAGELRSEAITDLRTQAGYDFYDTQVPSLPEEDKLGDTAGIFHGIPTFPALLALFIRMFGLANMQQVQSVFYLCTACFVLLITEDLNLKKSARLLAVSVVALSPVIQWVMKSSLTEGFLCLLYAGILYGLLDKHRYSKYLAALYIWGFAFFHVTIYVMIPLFAILFLLLYLETKDRQYLFANDIAVTGFAVGITMMCCVSPRYSHLNITNGFRFFEIIGVEKELPFMWAMAAVLIAVPALLARIDVQKVYSFLKREKVFNCLVRLVMLAVLALVIRRGVAIYRGEVERMTGGDWKELERLTLLVFGYATGIFAFAVTLFKLFLRPGEMLKSKENLVVGAAFFYCVPLMAALIRKEIIYLYYYSRYLAPYIVVCAVAMAVFLNALSKRTLSLLMVGGAAVLLPFDWTLATQKDESRVAWDILEDVLEIELKDGAILVGSPYFRTLQLPLEMATDLDTYPLLEDMQGEIDLLKNRYDAIYVLTAEPENMPWYKAAKFSILYRDQYVSSIDDRNSVGMLIPFAWDFYQASESITLLKCELPSFKYDFGTGDFPMYGMGNVENGEFRWLNEPEAGFIAVLEKKDYTMTVTVGPKVPLGALGLDDYSVDVYVNDNYAGQFTLEDESSDSALDYVVQLPEELFTEGKNDICFKADTWSPADIGSKDARNMTISLHQVQFTEPSA